MAIGAKRGAFREILVLVVIGGLIFFITKSGGTTSVTFDFELKAEDYSGLLVHIGIVAIIVERFIEVYTMIWRKPGRKMLEDAKKHEKDEDKRVLIEREITEYRGITGMQSMYMAAFIGVVISLAGIHTLNVLFDASGLEGWQSSLFYVTDIFVTAGLIAGGSNGVNKMSSLISDTVGLLRGSVIEKKEALKVDP